MRCVALADGASAPSATQVNAGTDGSDSAAVSVLLDECAKAQEGRRVAEIEARRKEQADKAAKVKAEKDKIKAQLALDRANVAARGPAQASVARKLPSVGAGTHRLDLDDDHKPERDGPAQ